MGNIESVQRINQAIDYIHKNLDKNLTAEQIADYCCFSRFYFSRMFRAVMSESVYSFIKRRKLENAAFLLRTKTNMSVTDIALRNGYSPSNFASTFKEHYGISATEYRKKNDMPPNDSYIAVVEHIRKMKEMQDYFGIIHRKIKIRKIEGMSLFYERFVGNYCDLPDFWEAFCKKVEKEQLINENTRFIGISYDNPLIIDENRCITDVCISVESVGGPNIHIIEEGYYACYEFHDKVINIAKAYNEMFSLWLPFCEYDLDHRLPLEIYHTVSDAGDRVHMDICIPIVKED
ncbi:AraC family transcriptional regulator [Petroclostridium sp. X23]|uniref:AraC family transcriptional regulator n=1 Tax=Petroclostridium sp. X23 TaxID=3045146 RepID=UPI0024AD5C0D|nr:AraC family transcriptional regulator [Petroclostridium sp. X23]WHH57804.1 AraC family transcriptional regulator [Petroclostridium sp. X23]